MPPATSRRSGTSSARRAQLNWPTGISIDSARGEIYVSNAAGDSINVFSATATGDVAPIRQIKGPKTLLRNPNGVSVDTVNGEVWVANFGNHTATAYRWDANGNVEPIRVIRSAPLNAPTTLISNPYMIAMDTRRDEVLVPNCVAQPRIAAYSSAADKNAVPSRIIEGQNTKLNRTVHAIAYDEIHDEIVVQSNIGQAVLTFRGGANGDEAPIRVIQGPKTLLRDPQSLFIDPVNNEIYVLNMGTDDTLLVYDRTAQGDVAPKRVLKSPGAVGGVGAVDPVSNLMFLSGRGNGMMVYDRLAQGTTPPLRNIGGGPVSGLMRPGRIVVHPPTRTVIVTSSAGQGTRDPETFNLVPRAYVGVWSQDASGDVAPQWTVAKGHLYMPRGLTLDPKKKTVIVSDKYMNSVMTFSLPEMYARPAVRETARAAALEPFSFRSGAEALASADTCAWSARPRTLTRATGLPTTSYRLPVGSGHIHPDPRQLRAGGHVDCLTVRITKREPRSILRRDDHPDRLARGIDHPDTPRSYRVEVSIRVESHAVRIAGSLPGAHVHEQPPVRHGTVRLDVVAHDDPLVRVVDKERLFIRRQYDAVGSVEVLQQQAQPAVLQEKDPLIGQLLLEIPRAESTATARVGEIQRPIGSKYQVVGTVQALAFIAIGQDCSPAVPLESDHRSVGLGRVDDPSFAVHDHAVGAKPDIRGPRLGDRRPVGPLQERRDPAGGRPLVDDIRWNIAHEQMRARTFPDPQNAVDEAEAVSNGLDHGA